MPGSFGPLAECRPGMKIMIMSPCRGFRKLDLSRIPPLARWAKVSRPRCGLTIGRCQAGAFHKELSGRCTSLQAKKGVFRCPSRRDVWQSS
jgi:hypothetical protein